MKKVFITLGVILVILVAAALILPVIFKDDIKNAIDKELEASVNADVLFDVDNFSLSIFSNFPNITATMKEFGVVNRAPFEGEVLFATEELEVEINLMSLMGDKPSLSGIYLTNPIINVKVLEDGSANYDIAVASEESAAVEEEEASSEFTFGIDHWSVTGGEIVYDDATIPFYLKLEGVEHSGSGDFSLDVFDLRTSTTAESVTVGYDGDNYLDGQTADINATITISEDFSRYTFKDNSGKINDFAITFDGWFFMGDDYFDMDLTYGGPDNTFKSLLSLVPGMYTADFADLKTSGDLTFNGMVKGKYDDQSMPAFDLNLVVDNAMFQYPDLPSAVENIALDMAISNPDGVIENTSINVKSFHMDFGNNPMDARLSIADMVTFETDAEIKASLNLGELNQMFPVDGLEMRGIFEIDASAKGTYDSTLNTMPVLKASMSLAEGYIKSSEFPIPLEDLHFKSDLSNASGEMADFVATVDDFTMIMDSEEFHANLVFSDLVNYTWKADLSGGINLGNITHIFPLPGITLEGDINASVNTEGNMAALDAGNYDQLPTSGSLSISDFVYSDTTLNYDVTISEASAKLNPQSMALESYTGTIGKSDIKMNGQVSNYMGFVLSDNELLKGTFDFSAGLLDLNELMPESEEEVEVEEESEPFSAIPVPKNIDFVMSSRINKIRYMDMDLNNASGQIILRDGVASFENMKFDALGGSFTLAGAYDTKDPDVPKYDFKLNIDNISIKESFETFTIVKKLAPVAANIIGNISTDFNISGELGQDLMPKLETVTGSGLLQVVEATFGNSNILQKLSTVTTLDQSNAVELKDILMSAAISDGRISVKPFDIKLGEYPGTVSGSTGLDGGVDYNIKLDVPASKLGDNFASLTSQLGIGAPSSDGTIPLNINMAGTYSDPKLTLMSSDAKQEVKEAITAKAKEEGTAIVQSLADSIDVKGKVANLLGTGKDTTKTDSTKTDVKKEATDKAKEALNNLFKKKKKKNN